MTEFVDVIIHGESMWPTFLHGDVAVFSETVLPDLLETGAVVLASHPFKSGVVMVKRIKHRDGDLLFLEGDQPDPTASEDSHNFGLVPLSNVLGLWTGKVKRA